MAERKIKSSIYYPEKLKEAIKKVVKDDPEGRSFNQIVISILAADEKIKLALKEMDLDK